MAVDQSRIKWLKEAGENFFSSACNNSGMVATKPGQDTNGWDFFVELPQNRIPLIRLDAQPAPVKFICQVKASDNLTNLTRPITVSNMEHLCRSMLPAFILMVDFSGGYKPINAYFCHIDKDRIAQTLKRIRELEKAGVADLHKRNINVTASQNEKIDLSELRWVESAIRINVGFDLSKYLDIKSNLLKMTGFENGHKVAKFSTTLSMGETVDAFLGLRDLDILDFEISSNRFGIEIPEEFAATAKLSIEAPFIENCYAVASSKKLKRRIRFPVGVKAPNIPDLTLDHFKILVEWPFTRCLIANNEIQVKIKIEISEEHSLSSLSSTMQVFEIISFPDAKIEFYAKGSRFAVLNVKDTIEGDPSFAMLTTQIKTLRLFLDAAGYRDDIELSLENLYDQRKDIRWMEILIGNRPVNLSAKFTRIEEKYYPPRKGRFARPIGFDFLDQTFIAWCEWNAKIEVFDDTLTAQVRSGSVWGYTFVSPNKKDHAIRMSKEFEQHCRSDFVGYLIYQETVLSSEETQK
ncbi:hypothetical protein [Methylobacterium sp. Leaf113]|uniref:hypothetical protein n=1 Tax=Methylobacterium sp. Leaf113 TaxID=1736259 RepID=UPI000A88E7C9|nr:hypothetical protein [Methylobacterium sp. Leaf113]